MATKKAKDLTPKSPAKVKGGGKPDSNNDNITLMRGAKPKVTKDLPPKSPAKVKGGRANDYAGNDNLTLVRGSKPSKKRDLPPRKTVKGGKRISD